jgi:hypothetical protein
MLRIAERLQTPRQPRRERSMPPRWVYLVVAAVLVIALIISAFTWAQPLIFQWLGSPSLQTATFDHATTVNRRVTVAGITLHVEQAYADAALTAVTFQLTSAHAARTSFDVDRASLLIGADGARYGLIIGVGLDADHLSEFEPLPLDRLGAPQTLTLVLPSVRANGPEGELGTAVTGPWQLTFQVNPQPGRSVVYDQAPVVHAGVAIQPLRLDLAPTGARLLLRISGLAPNTALFPLKHFVTHQELGGIRPESDFGLRVGVSLQGTSDGGPLELVGPGGLRLIPAWIALPSTSPAGDSGLPLNRQVVGPSGSVVLSVLFFTPLSASHGSARLTLDQIDVVANPGTGTETERLAHGPWTFTLPLAAP